MSGIHQGPERVIPFSFFRQRWNYELTRGTKISCLDEPPFSCGWRRAGAQARAAGDPTPGGGASTLGLLGDRTRPSGQRRSVASSGESRPALARPNHTGHSSSFHAISQNIHSYCELITNDCSIRRFSSLPAVLAQRSTFLRIHCCTSANSGDAYNMSQSR